LIVPGCFWLTLAAAVSSGSASMAISARPCAKSISPRVVLLGRMASVTLASCSIFFRFGCIRPNVTVVAPLTRMSARAVSG
jgi:hypothetical protein